jgi:outer membrane protein assembly factor BamB
MARTRSDTIYIGIGGHVVAVSAASGEELWRQKLKTATIVTISAQRDAIYAGAGGELFCLDPSTGEVRWHNKLPRLGLGVITFGESAAAIAAAHAEASAAAG